MRNVPNFKIIPPGHTFVAYNQLFLTSIRAKRAQNELYARAMSRCPDMYEFEGERPRNLIYYEGWGTFALVEEYFERIMKEIGDGQWDEVYALLDAYMLFVHRSCPRPTNIPDAQRKSLLFELHGSCVLTMLEALDKQGRLNVQNFPGLEYFLRYTIDHWVNRLCHQPTLALVGVQLDDDIRVSYIDICRSIAWRLFNNQTPQDHALHLAYVKEWVEWLEPGPTEQDFGYLDQVKWIQDWLEENWPWLRLGTKDPWYSAGRDIIAHPKHYNIGLQKTWDEFSKYSKAKPLVPPMGSSWEFMDWINVDCVVHLGDGLDYDPDDDEDGDTESTGWGVERPFCRM